MKTIASASMSLTVTSKYNENCEETKYFAYVALLDHKIETIVRPAVSILSTSSSRAQTKRFPKQPNSSCNVYVDL